MTLRRIAYLNDCRSHVNAIEELYFEDLACRFSTPMEGRKDGLAWMPVDIEVGPRSGYRVKSVSFLVLDVEVNATAAKNSAGQPELDAHGDQIKVVDGQEPPEVDAMLSELAVHNYSCFLHTSYSHQGSYRPEGQSHPRYRLVFDLSRTLDAAELRPLGLHVADLLGIRDCVDVGCLEPARLFYLPRCPADRLNAFRYEILLGQPIDVDLLLKDTYKISSLAANKSERTSASVGVIGQYNAVTQISQLLEGAGYMSKGGGRWLFPGSGSGTPGVRALPNSNGQFIYSSHAEDPLADGHAHDAFDCFRILNCGGDFKSAINLVRDQLKYVDVETFATSTHASDWGSPLPLSVKLASSPYPMEALPVKLRSAVSEVAGFVKAPTALVASSALSALSLSIQAHVDAIRAEQLTGPCGLFLLTVADSGERKSTCDSFFSRAIKDYEKRQKELLKPELADFAAAMQSWDAKRAGVREKIRALAKGGKATDGQEKALLDLELARPVEPKVPRLLFADVTPEALAYALARKWPSGGVVSSEAGIVLGSHGMGKESVMRNLALLNQLWDGASVTIDRRTSESFTVNGARLTVALQIQEATLKTFFDNTGGLARGTGFLARFLMAWPESTQGLRLFTEPPNGWPSLDAFNQRISEILEVEIPFSVDGVTPSLMPMSPGAKAAWVKFHDEIEVDLLAGHDLFEIRDVASKIADNASRIAVLFHVFEKGFGGAVSTETFVSASEIAKWHLYESKRFFSDFSLPKELCLALKLDSWIKKYCRSNQSVSVSFRDVQRLGPVRDSDKLLLAVRELTELRRLRLTPKPRQIEINPALLTEESE